MTSRTARVSQNRDTNDRSRDLSCSLNTVAVHFLASQTTREYGAVCHDVKSANIAVGVLSASSARHRSIQLPQLSTSSAAARLDTAALVRLCLPLRSVYPSIRSGRSERTLRGLWPSSPLTSDLLVVVTATVFVSESVRFESRSAPNTAGKMVSCGMKCIKYLLFVFNLVFFVSIDLSACFDTCQTRGFNLCRNMRSSVVVVIFTIDPRVGLFYVG